uniref:Uncharacterized protein n=1 Tax=Arundo donax TaxID=35708 RepID=A0A0A8ZEI6_ARUDO
MKFYYLTFQVRVTKPITAKPNEHKNFSGSCGRR